MPAYSEISNLLTQALGLAQPPIAVCLTDSVPAGVALWEGHAPAGCRFWQEAATRVFATTAADHGLCSIGLYTHNLGLSPAAETDLNDALKVFAGLTYVRPEDVAAIPVLKFQPKYVVYGPLADVPLDPDVVLLFVQASQTLILSEASQQLEGGLPPAMGRPACAVIPQAANSGRSALSLGCCGARAYLDTLTDDVALYAVPGSAIAAFAERIEALSKANRILQKFHQIRRKDVEAGKTPTVQESLAALRAAG
jgi:uncharacterized protein (DUF169 family)